MSSESQKLLQLYREALGRNVRERTAFLEQVCGGDEELLGNLRLLLERTADTETASRDVTSMSTQGAGDVPSTTEAVAPFFDGSHTGLPRAIDALRSEPSPFANLPAETVRGIVDVMELREYGSGDHLIRQDGPADYLLLILRGTASAQLRDAPADRSPIGQFRPGDIVGEMSLITDEARTADVVARTPVHALLLPADAFHKLADRHPELRVVLTDLVTNRLGHARFDGLGGKEIQGYQIVQCVGHGGMGVVYEARRVATGETVALKMMNHRLVYQPGALQRFRRESAILKTLKHQSIAQLYDVLSAYKTEFLVMEFCEGSTLKQILAARPVLEEEAVRKLLGQLAAALRYIHSVGIIHRDLKPSNVVVSDAGLVKLLDFGLVKLDAGSAEWLGTEAGDLSQAGVLLGTLRYMAPEQLSGRPTDRRADFYGLASIAYEAMAGRPAIEATDLYGIVREHLRFALPPREQIGRGVSIEMYDFLTRGLDPSPSKRDIDLGQLEEWSGPINLASR